MSSIPVDTEVGTWDKYSKEEYSNVTEASAKKSLDLELASLVTTLNKENVGSEPVRVGELGCGPAPVSTILEKFNDAWYKNDEDAGNGEGPLHRPLFETVGFDSNLGMTAQKDKRINFHKADISDPLFADEFIEKGGREFNTLVLENAWYAVTTGVGDDPEESLYRRNAVLYNAWRLLKENGTLIITDPLSSTKEVGIKNTLEGAWKEMSSAVSRGEFSDSIKNIQNPITKEAIKRNKEEILPQSQLFSFEEMKDFIVKSGLFEIESMKKGDYLGHNATVVLRKINKPEIKLNGTYALNLLDSKAKDLLAMFRRRNYSDKVNPIVTGIDSQDSKHKESITVVASLVGTNIPGAIATFDMEDDYEKDSWEFAELFDLPEDFQKIIPQNRKTGEVRRLGTISAYGQEYFRIGLSSITRVIERLYQEVMDRNVGVLFFTATPDRLGLFNGILKRFDLPGFEKVEDVVLNRESSTAVKTIITGARYFLTEEGYMNLEKDPELSALRRFLIENKSASIEDAVEALWPGKNSFKEEIYKKIQNKDTFPENVSLYYARVPNGKNGNQ